MVLPWVPEAPRFQFMERHSSSRGSLTLEDGEVPQFHRHPGSSEWSGALVPETPWFQRLNDSIIWRGTLVPEALRFHCMERHPSSGGSLTPSDGEVPQFQRLPGSSGWRVLANSAAHSLCSAVLTCYWKEVGWKREGEKEGARVAGKGGRLFGVSVRIEVGHT